jgi:hypothetical protein
MLRYFLIFGISRQTLFEFQNCCAARFLDNGAMTDLDWIREGLRKPGKSRSGLAAALGRAPSAVTALLKGERKLKADEITVISAYLEFDPPTPQRSRSVPIIGIAGAGADGSIVFSEQEGAYGEAPVPPGGTERTRAVEVRGESMRGIAEDGWLVYYDDRRDPPDSSMIGELCVVGLSDGRTLIKYLYPGTEAGLFNLESTTEATLRNVSIEWAAAVTAIIPRAAARRLIRRPDAATSDNVLEVRKKA